MTNRRWFTVDDATFDRVMQVLDAPLTDTSRFERLWNRPSPFGTRIELSKDPE